MQLALLLELTWAELVSNRHSHEFETYGTMGVSHTVIKRSQGISQLPLAQAPVKCLAPCQTAQRAESCCAVNLLEACSRGSCRILCTVKRTHAQCHTLWLRCAVCAGPDATVRSKQTLQLQVLECHV